MKENDALTYETKQTGLCAHNLQDRLTPEQTANELDVTPGTLSVWRCTGRYNLPYVKIGSKVRYRKSDIKAFIESRVKTHTNSKGEA